MENDSFKTDSTDNSFSIVVINRSLPNTDADMLEIASSAKIVYVRKSVLDIFESSVTKLGFNKTAEDDVFVRYTKE